MTKVMVDSELCTSNQECVRVAPREFAINEEGISTPTAAALHSPVDLLLRAARDCPVQAISLFGENGLRLYPLPNT